jgi:hypothetical protein
MAEQKVFVVGTGNDKQKDELNALLKTGWSVKDVYASGATVAHWLVVAEKDAADKDAPRVHSIVSTTPPFVDE